MFYIYGSSDVSGQTKTPDRDWLNLELNREALDVIGPNGHQSVVGTASYWTRFLQR